MVNTAEKSKKYTISQTPAPRKDRIYGSEKNPKGSASSSKSASKIELSESIINTLENKRDEYNEKHPNKKVTLSTLKAVFRRGAGAYSSSHRPTITGGAPNSRSAWAFARVNKFLLKKGGTKVKAAYVQDDDLMKKGGLTDSLDMAMENLKKNGIVLKDNDETITLIAYNTGNQERKPSLYNKALIYKSVEPIKAASEIIENFDSSDFENFDALKLEDYKKSNLIIMNQNEVVYDSENQDIKYEEGGDLGQEITCIRCGWHWNTNQSDEFDKYICHNCGFDNRTYYDSDPIGKYHLGGDIENEFDELDNNQLMKTLKSFYSDLSESPIFEYLDLREGDYTLNTPDNEFVIFKKKPFSKIESIKIGRFLQPYFDASKKPFFARFFDTYKVSGNNLIIKIKDMYEQGGLIAPNGKKSNLTPEQYKLVRTPEFKAWFGDWENNPENASKVVDENGEPKVMHHGTRGNFTIFSDENENKLSWTVGGVGFYFTTYYNAALGYGTKVISAFINAKNIKKSDESEHAFVSINDLEKLRNANYDAIYFDGQFTNTRGIRSWKDDELVVFEPTQIKLADGSNTTFDAENPDIRYAEGGKLKKPHNVIEIAEKHEVEVNKVIKALEKGIKKEKEHTTDYTTARTIALHHLWESPKYYDKLNKMEKELNIDEHYEDIKKIYAIGGVVDPVLSFSTPTGEPTKLTYLQQVLVRTSAFKNFFGNWEYAAKQFVGNGRQEYEYLYKNVSKVIDKITLEPKVVYHGTRVDSEFYVFDVSQQAGDGRPYGYFAHNIEYSQNFITSSQRGMANAQPFLYKCFVNIRNPFYAMTSEYYNIQRDAEYWKNEIAKTIALDKYTNQLDSNKLDTIKKVVDSQIGKYIDDTLGGAEYSFWILMARDKNKLFKYFLNNYRYDGIFYAEEFGGNYDVDNPSQFTEAVTIFEPSQVKLADGRNINFDPMNVDIRYAKGGDINITENIEKTSNKMGKRENLRNLLLGEKYAEGGEVIADKLKDGNDGKKGGYFEGRSHDEGGIKAYNKDTGQMIEVEGEEVIITKGAVKDQEKREFEGEMLTNREILSRINQSGGGVSFAKGGEMGGSPCGCSGKKYKYGGEMMDDYSIVKIMNRPFEIINDNFADARAFADMLVEKLK